jgi:hypothetical protein
LGSRQLCGYSGISQQFTETEGSLLCSQDTSTGKIMGLTTKTNNKGKLDLLLQHCDLKVNGWATDKWNL